MISTVPGTPGGDVTVICEGEDDEMVPLTAPNMTTFTPLRFVPEMVTLVPPACGPEAGLIPVIVGTAET